MTPDELQVYIVNLGNYNQGKADSGRWFHLPLDFDEIQEALQLGKNGQSEEYAIHDYELPVRISEYESISSLNQLYENLLTISDTPFYPIIQELLDEWFNNVEELAGNIDNLIYYDTNSMSELVAEEIGDGTLFGELPTNVLYYLDYEKIARDLEIEGNYLVTTHGIVEYVN